MSKREQTRQRWEEIVGRYEKAGMPQASFAVAHKVGQAALRYWIYKLRRQKAHWARPASPVRLLPVEVKGFAPTGSIEIRLDEMAIALPATTPAAYVAALASALRPSRC